MLNKTSKYEIFFLPDKYFQYQLYRTFIFWILTIVILVLITFLHLWYEPCPRFKSNFFDWIIFVRLIAFSVICLRDSFLLKSDWFENSLLFFRQRVWSLLKLTLKAHVLVVVEFINPFFLFWKSLVILNTFHTFDFW